MNIIGRLTCKPSGYGEYDNLTGYIDHEYSIEWTDADGTKWRTIVTVINLGRPDRGEPVDPDAAMVSEDWGERERLGYTESLADAREAHRQVARQRHAQIQMKVVEYLMARGPMNCNEMASDIGVSKNTLMPHLRQREGSAYVQVGYSGRSVLWGVIGVHETGKDYRV